MIVPVVAPDGTVATSCVVVAEVTVAVVPWNLTVLFAMVLLKPVPEIVTDAPTAPLLGENPLMVGAAHAGAVHKRNNAEHTHEPSHATTSSSGVGSMRLHRYANTPSIYHGGPRFYWGVVATTRRAGFPRSSLAGHYMLRIKSKQ